MIAEGLLEFELLRERPEVPLETGAVSMFFPHGIEHMVGLGVRDAGEACRREPMPGMPQLRADLRLMPGTCHVEPSLYFVVRCSPIQARARLRASISNMFLASRTTCS